MDDLKVPGQEDGRRALPLALLLFVVSAAIFIVLRSGAYNPDMPWQSAVAEGLRPVTFPPDHLLYGVMVRGIWNVWQALGLPGRAHVALQAANGLLGGIMVATMFALTLRLTKRRLFAVCTAVVFGLTPYVWHHATDVETYGVAKTLLLLALYFTFLLAEGGSSRRRYRLALVVAVFHAFAALMQYKHVFLVPAVVVAAFVPRDGAPLSVRVKTACLYLVAVGALVWGPFLCVAHSEGIRGVGGLFTWLKAPDYGWAPFSRMGWVKTPLKFISSFTSWPTPFGLPSHEAKRVLLGHIPFRTYMAANWWRIPILAALALLQLALLTRYVVWRKRIWAKWRVIQRLEAEYQKWREPIIVALVVLLFYQGFALYWGGGFGGQAVVVFFILWPMAFAAVLDTPREGRLTRVLAVTTPWICAVCMGAAFVFSYIPEHNEANNLDLTETRAVAGRVTPKDLIVSTGGCNTSEYWTYFTPEVDYYFLCTNSRDPGTDQPGRKMMDGADKLIVETLKAGGKVYVHRIFADEDEVTRPWNEMLRERIRRKDVVDHFKRYRYEKAFVHQRSDKPDGSQYWRILALPDEVEAPEAPEQPEPKP